MVGCFDVAIVGDDGELPTGLLVVGLCDRGLKVVGVFDVGLADDGFDDDDVGLDVDGIRELGLKDGFDFVGENTFVIVGKPVVGPEEVGTTVLSDSLGISVGATEGVVVGCNVVGFNDVGFKVLGDLVIGF